MDITDSRVIVTGAATGIGLATVRALLDAGAGRIGMVARDRAKLDAAIEGLAKDGGTDRITPLVADVRDAEALSRAFTSFVEAAGKLDVLVNNAGVLIDGAMVSFSFKGVGRYPIESWQTTIETNLTGSFLAAQLAAEHMIRKRAKGVIVNVSSVSRNGRAGQSAYSASKGAIVSMTYSLAQELAPFKIRCVAVAPGLVDTPMAERIPENYRKQMLSHVAAGRMGRPDEIAHGIVFCIENDFFDGRVLELDGGAFG
jgi:3-oxoacyl-[acyl-carrier protein] reductase